MIKTRQGIAVRPLLGALGCSLMLGTAVQASAQDAPPAGDMATGSEEVTVTARKKSERLIDVPVSGNVLGTAALERYATTDLTSVGVQIPQVSIDQAPSGSGAIITVRGVGSASVDAAIEQAVTVNIDGVPTSRGRVLGQASFDQASIQVFKGPQALYFGKNSPAGVIAITSADPTDELSGYARGGYEFEAREYYAEGAISGTLFDGLTARLALRASKMEGGYIEGIAGPVTDPAQLPAFVNAAGLTLPGSPYGEYPGNRDAIGRLTLKYDTGSRFNATFKFLVADHKDRGDSMQVVNFSCPVGFNHPTSTDLGAIFLTGAPGLLVDQQGTCGKEQRANSQGVLPPEIAANYPGAGDGTPFTSVRTYLGSLTMNYDLTEQLSLTSVTGYYKYSAKQFSNYDQTVYSAASGKNDDAQTSWTQELRLASDFSGPVNFTAGFFYSDDDRTFDQSGSIGYFGPDPVTGQTNLFSSLDFYTGETWSGFAELSWEIAPDLTLAGGGRYTSETKTGDLGQTYVHTLAALLGIAAPVGQRFGGEVTQENFSPQVTLTYKPEENVTIYGAYKTGYKSGGFSTPALIPATATDENQQFGQEKVTGYEAGIKFSKLDRRLNGDLTVYNYQFKGLQLTAFDAVTTSYFTQNAGSATVSGVEFNIDYRVTDEFSVRSSIGYNRARYDTFQGAQCWAGQTVAEGCVGGVQDLSGNPLSRAPDWSLLAGASYDTPVGGDFSLGLTADVRYSSDYFIQTSNNPYGHQDAYTTFDASARLYNADWEVALIGRNLNDAYYAVLGGDKPLGQRGDIIASLGKPRTVTLQVTRNF